LSDKRQSVAKASREYDLRVFAAFNAGLDEFDEAQDVASSTCSRNTSSASIKEFSKILKVTSVNLDLSRGQVGPPKTRPYHYLAGSIAKSSKRT